MKVLCGLAGLAVGKFELLWNVRLHMGFIPYFYIATSSGAMQYLSIIDWPNVPHFAGETLRAALRALIHPLRSWSGVIHASSTTGVVSLARNPFP